MRLAFETLDWVSRLLSSVGVGFIQPVEGLHRTKKTSETLLFLLTCLPDGHWSTPAFGACCSVGQSCPTLCNPMDNIQHQALLSLTISRSLPKFTFIASVTPSSHLILWCPLLLFHSIFPSIRDFSSHLCTSDDQNTGASASVLPVNIQGWPPLSLTGWISLLSGVFSRTTVRRHQFFGFLPSLWSSSHNRTWPLGNHSLDYTDLCRQSNVSAFQHTV